MTVTEVKSGKKHKTEIVPIVAEDYESITKYRFWFNWKTERDYDVYKLRIRGTDDILGLVSLETLHEESRIEIRLLAVSKENRGMHKKYEHIAGNLIAFACIISVKLFGEWACVSLVPKTKLIDHYMTKYSMLQSGKSLFLDGRELIELIKRYDYE